LARRDWPAYGDVMPAPIPEEDRRHVEAQNDPVALSAVAEAMCEPRYTVDLTRIMAPRFLYCGGDDLFASLMALEAEALGVTLHIVDGADHMGCFNRPKDVMAEVLAFLSPLDGRR
jgi:pimeloyl-ACP methyl ester carboxylesterase